MSEKLDPRADKLIFNISSQEKNFCDCFVYEPVNASEEKLGSAYMIGELKDVSEDSFFVLNHIATLFKRNYYSNTQKPCLIALEDALKKVNEGMQELAFQKKTEWIGKLHFVIGILSQNTFYFTLCGTPRIFFVRHGETTDVGEKISMALKETSPNKIFKNVASGRVEKDDKIFMMTSETFQSISKELWRETINSFSPAKKIKELSSSQRLNLSHTGGMMIISLSGGEEHDERTPLLPLYSVQEKIEKIRRLRNRNRGKLDYFILTLKRILKFTYVILRFAIKSLIYLLGKIIFWIGKVLGLLWIQLKKIKFFQNFEDKIKSIPQKSFVKNTAKIIGFFRKKTVYVPFIVLLITLCGFAGFQYQKKEAKLSEWRNILNQAKEKYKEGEISLIYGAKEKSIASFGEVETFISRLEGSGYLKKETKELKESTLAKLQKLLNIVVIEKPEVVATLGNFSIKFNIQKIAATHDQSLVFASDPSSALFYKFSTKNKKGEFSLAPIPEGGVSKAERIKNFVVFFAQPKSIFFYIPEEDKFNDSRLLSFPYEDFSFNDFTVYKNSLFFLDSKAGEIIKFTQPENINDPPAAGKIWLKRTTKKPIGAKSIACDGNILILDQNGDILKYVNGTFIQTLKTNLPLGNPVKIWTPEEQPLIYVLDSQKKNLTLLDKTGQVQKQFFSDKFNDLKDFWISENGKEIYLLNGNQVFLVKNEE